jgi:hypothetical protein
MLPGAGFSIVHERAPLHDPLGAGFSCVYSTSHLQKEYKPYGVVPFILHKLL